MKIAPRQILFYCLGKFHFSSNLSGKTLILKYISDGLVTNGANTALDLGATKIHKFAEEAINKGASYAIIDDHSLNNPKFIKWGIAYSENCILSKC